MNIIVPSTYMKLEPNHSSTLETECLYGEKIKILEETTHWVYCQLFTDNYLGWVCKNALGHSLECTHRVIAIRSYLFTKKNIKSNIIHYLPMGSKLPVKKIDTEWAEVFLPENKKTAYVPLQHIVKINHKVKDWVSIAEQLLNVPYRWGGRDTHGIDCSSLIQLSYETYGEILPRNSKDQIKVQKKIILNHNNLERGYVVFWDGHVGVMSDKINCIHSNAFHMKTVKEPLENIILRMKEKYKLSKCQAVDMFPQTQHIENVVLLEKI